MSNGIYSLDEIVNTACEKVPFFKEFYKGINPAKISIKEIPELNHKEYWRAAKNNISSVLSDEPNGIVFKSGGTTGSPKFSFYSNEEWKTFTQEFGWGMSQGALEAGDRIENLFYAGDLYASFLFIFSSLFHSKTPHLQLPVTGATNPANICESIKYFNANTICGVPTTLLNFAEYLMSKGESLPIEKILYGGEALYPDQETLLLKVFPKAKAYSLGYASVDAGLLGYASKDCQQRVHRVFSRSTIFEIVDVNSGEVIEEVGRPGKVLLTNLTRKLMPIIRYPAGDLAQWVEPEGAIDRAFEILGRSDEGARIGPVTLFYDDILILAHKALTPKCILGLQIETTHLDAKDSVLFRFAVEDLPKAEAKLLQDKFMEALFEERKELKSAIDKKLVHWPQVEFCAAHDLKANARTGKLVRVIDKRL